LFLDRARCPSARSKQRDRALTFSEKTPAKSSFTRAAPTTSGGQKGAENALHSLIVVATTSSRRKEGQLRQISRISRSA
jgi:hypothetical protein